MKTIEAKVYKCGECGNLYWQESRADQCCPQKIMHYCEKCGKELLEPLIYGDICTNCRTKLKVEKANEKLTFAEYLTKYPGYPMVNWKGDFVSLNNEYDFYEWADALDDYGVDMPFHMFGTKKRYVELDAETLIEHLNEQVMFKEEIIMFGEEAADALATILEPWNKEFRYEYYDQDFKVAILIDKDALEHGRRVF